MQIMRFPQHLFIHVAQGGDDGAAPGDSIQVMRSLAADADDSDV
jgi:hypothetical protein